MTCSVSGVIINVMTIKLKHFYCQIIFIQEKVKMKNLRTISLIAALVMSAALAGCGTENGSSISSEDTTAAVTEETTVEETTAEETTTETETTVSTTESETEAVTEAEQQEEVSAAEDTAQETENTEVVQEASSITSDMAYEAVNNYCHQNYDWSISEENPDIMYVTLGDETENEYKVVFRSYTGSFRYFYVDKQTGNARIVDYVPTLDLEEEAGSISIYDYLS